MKKLILVVAFTFFSSTAHATLIDGGSFAYDDGAGNTGFVNLIYDNDFDITWVGDGNFAQTTGFDADGRMDWDPAIGWAAGLTIGGFTGWRLPTAFNQDGSGPDRGLNVTGSEMGHLFYGELGGTANNAILSSGDPDLVLFPNLQNVVYWFGEENALDTGGAWDFDFGRGAGGGTQSTSGKFSASHGVTTVGFALAVHLGDVAGVNGGTDPVPEPTTVALLGIGLAGLAGAEIRRRRKKNTVGKS